MTCREGPLVADARTHEGEDPVSVLLPAFDHSAVFISAALEYMEKSGSELSPNLDFPKQG